MDIVVTKRVACSWEEGFAALEQFKAREAHCNVPRGKVEGAVTLGRWVRAQRANRDKLLAARRKRLDAIGFIWNLRDQGWEASFTALEQFRTREGHSCVPQHHVEGACNLGQWVGLQRARRAQLHVKRKRRLDSVGFVWDPRLSYWEDMFGRLSKYRRKHGNCNVSGSYSDNLLARWVLKLRSRKGRLSEDQVDRLNGLGFVWDPFDAAWQRGLAALRQFKSREGHARVPESHVEVAYKLGAWVKEQRRKENAMIASRKEQLHAIGFWKQSIVGRNIS
jgi:hypothetical protein